MLDEIDEFHLAFTCLLHFISPQVKIGRLYAELNILFRSGTSMNGDTSCAKLQKSMACTVQSLLVLPLACPSLRPAVPSNKVPQDSSRHPLHQAQNVLQVDR